MTKLVSVIAAFNLQQTVEFYMRGKDYVGVERPLSLWYIYDKSDRNSQSLNWDIVFRYVDIVLFNWDNMVGKI